MNAPPPPEVRDLPPFNVYVFRSDNSTLLILPVLLERDGGIAAIGLKSHSDVKIFCAAFERIGVITAQVNSN